MHIKTILEILLCGFYINECFGIKAQVELLKSTVENILHENFRTNGPVLILLSSLFEDKSERLIENEDFSGTMQWLEDLTLKIIYEKSFWPIVTFHADEELSIDEPLIENDYIIFINPKTEDFEDILSGNIFELEKKLSLHHHSKFLILALTETNESSVIFPQTVLSVLKSYGVMNSAVLIISRHS